MGANVQAPYSQSNQSNQQQQHQYQSNITSTNPNDTGTQQQVYNTSMRNDNNAPNNTYNNQQYDKNRQNSYSSVPPMISTPNTRAINSRNNNMPQYPNNASQINHKKLIIL